jgi:hypothetical protein
MERIVARLGSLVGSTCYRSEDIFEENYFVRWQDDRSSMWAISLTHWTADTPIWALWRWPVRLLKSEADILYPFKLLLLGIRMTSLDDDDDDDDYVDGVRLCLWTAASKGLSDRNDNLASGSISVHTSKWFSTSCKILRHWSTGFTSPLKEDVLRILISLNKSIASAGSETANLGYDGKQTISSPRRLFDNLHANNPLKIKYVGKNANLLY